MASARAGSCQRSGSRRLRRCLSRPHRANWATQNSHDSLLLPSETPVYTPPGARSDITIKAHYVGQTWNLRRNHALELPANEAFGILPAFATGKDTPWPT